MEYSPRKLFGTTLLLSVFSMPMLANAALHSRLGGQAYFDDVANLTWLADANYAATTGYANYYGDLSAAMSCSQANTWATGLEVAGVTGWRLPETLHPDASCDHAYHGYNCIGSEMGNMFYNVLGGSGGPYTDLASEYNHNANYDLFTNIAQALPNPGYYWSSTRDESKPRLWHLYVFDMRSGYQLSKQGIMGNHAWAVHSGDVGAVPVPAAVWLFGSGILGLIGFSKRKKAAA